MSDTYQAKNEPLNSKLTLSEVRATKDFYHQCGKENQESIINGVVCEMATKVGGLLQRSLNSDDDFFKIILGTACSGTDAPALALSLLKDQLKNVPGFTTEYDFDHLFSCEIEPFKQAYIARNFDVTLYGDICRLIDDELTDVWGTMKPIEGATVNMFVAGT